MTLRGLSGQYKTAIIPILLTAKSGELIKNPNDEARAFYQKIFTPEFARRAESHANAAGFSCQILSPSGKIIGFRITPKQGDMIIDLVNVDHSVSILNLIEAMPVILEAGKPVVFLAPGESKGVVPIPLKGEIALRMTGECYNWLTDSLEKLSEKLKTNHNISEGQVEQVRLSMMKIIDSVNTTIDLATEKWPNESESLAEIVKELRPETPVNLVFTAYMIFGIALSSPDTAMMRDLIGKLRKSNLSGDDQIRLFTAMNNDIDAVIEAIRYGIIDIELRSFWDRPESSVSNKMIKAINWLFD